MFVSPQYVLGVIDDGFAEEALQVEGCDSTAIPVVDTFFPWLFEGSDDSFLDCGATAAARSSSTSSIQIRQLSLHFNKSIHSTNSRGGGHEEENMGLGPSAPQRLASSSHSYPLALVKAPPSNTIVMSSVPPLDSAALVDPLLTSISHQLAMAREDAAIARKRERSRRRLGRATAAVVGERRRGEGMAASAPSHRCGGSNGDQKEEGQHTKRGVSPHHQVHNSSSTTINAMVSITTTTDSIRTIIPAAASALIVGLIGHTLEHALVVSSLQNALQLAAMLCPDGRLGAFTIALRKEDTYAVRAKAKGRTTSSGPAATLASVFFGTERVNKTGEGPSSCPSTVIRACTVSLSMTRQPFWHSDWWNTPLLALIVATIQSDFYHDHHHHHHQHTGQARNSFSTSAAAGSSTSSSGLEGAIGACAHRFIGRTLAKMRRGGVAAASIRTTNGGYRPQNGVSSPLPLLTSSFIYEQWATVRAALSQLLSVDGGGGAGPLHLTSASPTVSSLNRFIRLLCAIIIASELRLAKSEDIIDNTRMRPQHSQPQYHRQQQRQGEDALAAAALLDHSLQPATKADWEGLRALTELMADLQNTSGVAGEGRRVGRGGSIDVDGAMASLLGVLRTGTIPLKGAGVGMGMDRTADAAVEDDGGSDEGSVETILCDTGVAPFHGRVLPTRRISMLPTELGHMAVDMLEGAVGRRLGAGNHHVYPVEGSVLGGAVGDGGRSDWDGSSSSSSSEESGESDDDDAAHGGGDGMSAGTRRGSTDGKEASRRAIRAEVVYINVSACAVAHTAAPSTPTNRTATAANPTSSSSTCILSRNRLLTGSIYNHHRLLDNALVPSATSPSTDSSNDAAATTGIDPQPPLPLPLPLPLRALLPNLCYDHSVALCGVACGLSGVKKAALKTIGHYANAMPSSMLPQGLGRRGADTIAPRSMSGTGRSHSGYTNRDAAVAEAERGRKRAHAMHQLVCDATRIGLLACHEGWQFIPPPVAAEADDAERQPWPPSSLLRVTHSMGAVVYDAHSGGGERVLLPWPKGLTRDQLESLAPSSGGGANVNGGHTTSLSPVRGGGRSSARLSDHFAKGTAAAAGGGAQLKGYRRVLLDRGQQHQYSTASVRSPLRSGGASSNAIGVGRGNTAVMMTADEFKRIQQADIVDVEFVTFLGDSVRRFVTSLDAVFAPLLSSAEEEVEASQQQHSGGDLNGNGMAPSFLKTVRCFLHIVPAPPSPTAGGGGDPSMPLFLQSPQFYASRFFRGLSLSTAALLLGRADASFCAPPMEKVRDKKVGLAKCQRTGGGGESLSAAGVGAVDQFARFGEGVQSVNNSFASQGAGAAAAAAATLLGARGGGGITGGATRNMLSSLNALSSSSSRQLNGSRSSKYPAGLNSTIRINTPAAAMEERESEAAEELNTQPALPPSSSSAFIRSAGSEQTVEADGGDGDDSAPPTLCSSFAVGSSAEADDDDGRPSFVTMTLSDFCTAAFPLAVATNSRFVQYMATRVRTSQEGGRGSMMSAAGKGLSDVDFVRLLCEALQMPSRSFTIHHNPPFDYAAEDDDAEDDDDAAPTITLSPAVAAQLESLQRSVDRDARRRVEAIASEAQLLKRRSSRQLREKPWRQQQQQQEDASAGGVGSNNRSVSGGAASSSYSHPLHHSEKKRSTTPNPRSSSSGGLMGNTTGSILPTTFATSTSSKLAAIVAEKKRRSEVQRAEEVDGRMKRREESIVKSDAPDREEQQCGAASAVRYQIISGRRPSPSPRESFNEKKRKMATIASGGGQENSSALLRNEGVHVLPMDIGSGSFIVKDLLESRGGSEEDNHNDDDAHICSVTEVTVPEAQRRAPSCSLPFPVHYVPSQPTTVAVEEVSAFPHPRPSSSTTSMKSLLNSAAPMGGGENDVGTMTDGTLLFHRRQSNAAGEAYGEEAKERRADDKEEEEEAHGRSESESNAASTKKAPKVEGGTPTADGRTSISSRRSSRPQKASSSNAATAAASLLLIPPWRRKESLTDLVKLNANASQRIDMRRAEASATTGTLHGNAAAATPRRADAASTDVSYIDLGTSPIRRRPPLSASSLLVRGHQQEELMSTSGLKTNTTSAEEGARARERQRSVSFVGSDDPAASQKQQTRKKTGTSSPSHHHIDPSTTHHSHHHAPTAAACFDCLVPSHFRNRSPTSSSVVPTASQRKGHHAHVHAPLGTPPPSSRKGSRIGTPTTTSDTHTARANGYTYSYPAAANGAFSDLPADEQYGNCAADGGRNGTLASSQRGSAAVRTAAVPPTPTTTAASSINVSAITAVLPDGDDLPIASRTTSRGEEKVIIGRQPTAASSHAAPLRSVADFHALISATLGDDGGADDGAYASYGGGGNGEEGLGGSGYAAVDGSRRVYKL